MRGEIGERRIRSGDHEVTFHLTNDGCHSSAVKSFGDELRQHSKELEQ